MKINITFQNLAKVKKNFSNREQKIKEVTKRILEKSVLLVERFSKIESPVRTGRLCASITEGKELFDTFARIGPTVEYAPYVHWRNPFMKRGVDNALPEIRKVVKNEVEDAIK